MTTMLRVAPKFSFGSRRSFAVVERNALAYRRQWLLLISGFFEPLFYLLSIGIGLNHLVGRIPISAHFSVPYAVFVAPGMLATSAMNGAVIDSIYNTFFKLKISHSYDPVLATPLDVNDIALGEVLWSLIRGALYSTAFIICMMALGDFQSYWVILCLPAALLTSFVFACVGLAACTWLRTWQDFDTVALVQLPLFLFSGTFFSISLYPGWLGAIITCTPLYQSVALLRSCALGQFSWGTLINVAYLLTLGMVGLIVTGRRFRRLLSP